EGAAVGERWRRRLASLSAKYIALFALLVAVPVTGTSAYLLYSSYQDNKRALTRLQQEKAKSVAVTIDQYFRDLTKRMTTVGGRYLSFTALGAVLQPLIDNHAADAFYVVDARGVPIAHPNAAAFTHRSLAFPQVARALGSSSTGSTAGRNYRGERVLSTWATVDLLGWKVFVEQPESAAFAPIRGKIW